MSLPDRVTPLFEPLRLRGVALKNRVVMSPMLMYMADDDGKVIDLHFVHYGARIVGDVGAVMLEVVAVEPRGRIRHRDLGLWEDAQIAGLKRLVDFAHACDCPIGLQLAHAGRKAVLNAPIGAPSALAYSKESALPVARGITEIPRLIAAYRAAVARAVDAGFDLIEVHAAHGYLLHEFLAPIANSRTDDYGGDLVRRARLPLEVIEAVRAAWPQDRPLLVRMSATDHLPNAVTPEDALWFAQELRIRGVDLLDVSAGNIVPGHPAAVYPGYQYKVRRALEARRGNTRGNHWFGGGRGPAGGSTRCGAHRSRIRRTCSVAQPVLADRCCAPGWGQSDVANSYLCSRRRPL